jgi:hypothetical protein
MAVKLDGIGGGGSAGSRRDWTSDKKNIKLDVKTSFFDVMSEVQKYLKDVSAEIGWFKKIYFRRILSRIWCQIWRGQVWPRPVELGLTDISQTSQLGE